MMLEMKRILILLSVVILTGAAPLQQNKVWSSSQKSQFRVKTGSDIIIQVPAGFGNPDERGQRTVTVSLRDENMNISIDLLSFMFSVSSEEPEAGGSDKGLHDNEVGAEDSDEKLDGNKEETSSPREEKSEEDQIPSSWSDTRADSEEESDAEQPNKFKTTTSDTSSLQRSSNRSMVHPQSEPAEPSVQHYLQGQLPRLRLAPAASLIHQGTISAEVNSRRITGPTRSKSPGLPSGPEFMVNTEVEKKNEVPSTPSFSGSDFSPEYVNDGQYDPRYYDVYRNHPEYDPYGAGYDPYGEGHDPYGAGYDPYGAGHDPYGAGYDPYGAGHDPYAARHDPYGAGYDPYGESYDPNGTGYDPYQAGHDNQGPYHETESEDPRRDVDQETTPEYLVEENRIRPTETSNNRDNSYSEEHHQSPSSTPGSLPEGSESMDSAHNVPSEEPSNFTSVESSSETGLRPSQGLNESRSPPDPAMSNSEEVPEAGADDERKKAVGSSSSEESVEPNDSEQENQNPTDFPLKQGTPDPDIHTSMFLLSQNILEAYSQEEAQNQSPVDLIPAFSSEEDDSLVNTIEHHMVLAFNGGSNGEDTSAGSTPSNNTISETNQNEESFSNESLTGSPGISAEVTHESVHPTTDSPPFDSESTATTDSLISNEDTSSENITLNPSADLHVTTRSSEGSDNSDEANANANANTAYDSDESQESQIFSPSTVLPIAKQPRYVQDAENSSDEEDAPHRKSHHGPNRQLPLESPAKIIATNFWASFVQAMRVPLASRTVQRNVRGPQSSRRYDQRSGRKPHANSSEERK